MVYSALKEWRQHVFTFGPLVTTEKRDPGRHRQKRD